MGKRRFLFSIAALITSSLVFLLVFLVLFSTLSQASRYKSYLLQSRNADTLVALERLKMELSEAENAFQDYLNTKNTYRLEDFHRAKKASNDAIEDLERLLKDDKNALFTLYSIKESFKSYSYQCEKAFELFGLNISSYYMQKVQADSIATYLNRYADELLSSIIESNTASLAEDARSYSLFITLNIIFLIIFTLFLILIVIIYSRNIRCPLRELGITAERISQGELNARSSVSSRDKQVTLLTATFNNMADDVVKAMEDQKKKAEAEKQLLEEQKKNLMVQAQLDRATFLALQTQTNPHFLFNTLNSIDRTIQLNKINDARTMLHSISSLMRYNLSDASAPAVLREEIEVTKEYLLIQKARFSSRFSYEIDIPDILLDTIFIPRFTLQPLVENAIIHGLKDKEEEAKVAIRAEERGDDVILTISDNGSGMSEEKIKECLSRNYMEGKHIGISNTKHRLELFTGKKNALIIKSKLNEGTLIIITLRREYEQ